MLEVLSGGMPRCAGLPLEKNTSVGAFTMTQLLLFDPFSTASPVVSGLPPQAAAAAVRSTPESRRGASSTSGSLPLYDPRQGEVHRMGDLARLVLARYDLVAQRRAAMRSRRSGCA